MNFEKAGTKRTKKFVISLNLLFDGAKVVLAQSTENPTDIEKVIAWSLTLV